MENSLLYPVNSASRRAVSLDGMWKFRFDPESAGLAAGWTQALPDPVSMPVPSSFCDLFTDKDSREYCGDFWYETDFFVPGEWQGGDVVLRFGSVTHRARVFVNGAEVASHEGGFLPFNADVTDVVRYNARNRLTVLGNNELYEYTLPAGRTAVLKNGKKVAAPYFDFYNYAGIQRPVKLLCLPKERITDFFRQSPALRGGRPGGLHRHHQRRQRLHRGGLRRRRPQGGGRDRQGRHAAYQQCLPLGRSRRLPLYLCGAHCGRRQGGGRVQRPHRHPHL